MAGHESSCTDERIAPLPPGTVDRNRRKQYIVNAAFQWKYAVTVSVAVFFIASILSSVLYSVLHHQARMRLIDPAGYTADVGPVVLMFAFAFSVLAAGGVGLWCVLFTHRMCGPLFVLQNYLREIAEGRLPDLRPLRRKDEFKELYATFARAVEALKIQRRREVAALAEALEIARNSAQANEQTVRDALSSIRQQLEQWHQVAADGLAPESDELTEDSEPDETAGVSGVEADQRAPAAVG